MPAPLDYPRIIADARARSNREPDARRPRAQRARIRRPRLRIPGWLAEPWRASGDGLALPALRDYPWRSSERA
jgi:hypothetical protein